MSDEAAFLEAIAIDPTNRAKRLVYADWLDERADPRGTLVRLEEAMRTLSPLSDRYWELKRERNRLKAECDDGWLGDMLYGTDYEPVFRHVPRTVKERWRLIREFVERWYGIPMPDAGGQSEVVDEIASAVGPLPESCREWIAFHADLQGREVQIDILLGEFRVASEDSASAISLAFVPNGSYCWGVELDRLAEDDPPVTGYRLVYDGDDDEMLSDGIVSARVSTFALKQLMGYFNSQLGDTVVPLPIDDRIMRQLQAQLAVSARFDDLLIFEDANFFACVCPTDESKDRAELRFATWKEVPGFEYPAALELLMVAGDELG